MQRATVLLLLALVAPAFGGPVAPASLFPTQENFNKQQFMGKWYEIAMASSSAHPLHRGERSMSTWELESGDSNAVNVMMTAFRHGLCKEMSSVYEMTETPGRMSYHTKHGTVVNAYVVHTNYDEYAIIALSQERQGDNRTISFKLFGRSMELRPTLMTDFSQLVKEQGMGEDSVIVLLKKEKCTPGDIALETEFQRVRRNVALLTPAEEGSGDDDTPIFRNPDSCQMAPVVGPCFGMVQRFHYNSTLMACLPFFYGGCLGNQNNFVSEKECLQGCRTEAACRLPIDEGSCTLNTELWAFNSTEGKCIPFKYGGCKGNGNKFYSQKECDEYCGVVKDGDEELLKKN
ncbi:protein AMBP [Conger conger]|nr:protein AMBP [Conger conger]